MKKTRTLIETQEQIERCWKDIEKHNNIINFIDARINDLVDLKNRRSRSISKLHRYINQLENDIKKT
jgi:DNA repair ATPase RecN